METVQQIIHRRRSVRTYSGEEIETEKLAHIQDMLSSPMQGPFGNEVKFVLFDISQLSNKEAKKLGTYGIIKGARHFVAGSVQDAEGAVEDFGYCMEKLILELTRMNLGTCWLAGTFRRKNFADKIGMAAEELLPAVTPFGYIKDNRSIIDRSLQYMAKSRARKPFSEIFFHGDLNSPLDESEAGEYRDALEAVRVGPSASNKQPWVIIKERGGNIFHFFLRRTPGYVVKLGKIKIQNLDLGVAMCHFELVTAENGQNGEWIFNAPAPDIETGEMEYIATWRKA